MRSSTACISHARSAVLPPAIAMQMKAKAIRRQWRQIKSRTRRRTSAHDWVPSWGIGGVLRIGLQPPVLGAGGGIGKTGGSARRRPLQREGQRMGFAARKAPYMFVETPAMGRAEADVRV